MKKIIFLLLFSLFSTNIYSQNNFKVIVAALTNLSAQTVDVELDADTTYYWRVKSSDGTNASYSIVYSFKTQ